MFQDLSKSSPVKCENLTYIFKCCHDERAVTRTASRKKAWYRLVLFFVALPCLWDMFLLSHCVTLFFEEGRHATNPFVPRRGFIAKNVYGLATRTGRIFPFLLLFIKAKVLDVSSIAKIYCRRPAASGRARVMKKKYHHVIKSPNDVVTTSQISKYCDVVTTSQIFAWRDVTWCRPLTTS